MSKDSAAPQATDLGDKLRDMDSIGEGRLPGAWLGVAVATVLVESGGLPAYVRFPWEVLVRPENASPDGQVKVALSKVVGTGVAKQMCERGTRAEIGAARLLRLLMRPVPMMAAVPFCVACATWGDRSQRSPCDPSTPTKRQRTAENAWRDNDSAPHGSVRRFGDAPHADPLPGMAVGVRPFAVGIGLEECKHAALRYRLTGSHQWPDGRVVRAALRARDWNGKVTYRRDNAGGTQHQRAAPPSTKQTAKVVRAIHQDAEVGRVQNLRVLVHPRLSGL